MSKVICVLGVIFLIDRFVDLFKEKVVSKDFFDMNYIEYDFSKVDLQKLKMDCETSPFFKREYQEISIKRKVQ